MELPYEEDIKREANIPKHNANRIIPGASITRNMVCDLTSPTSSTGTHERLALNPVSRIGLDNNPANKKANAKANAGCKASRKDCVRNK